LFLIKPRNIWLTAPVATQPLDTYFEHFHFSDCFWNQISLSVNKAQIIGVLQEAGKKSQSCPTQTDSEASAQLPSY